MQSGWFELDGATYCTSGSGKLYSGWQKINKHWYYFAADNFQMQKGWLKTGGNWYYLNSDGVMQTGWLTYKEERYYFNGDGAMCTGWKKLSGNWYYLDPATGAMQTGWLELGDKSYYLKEDGVMVTGLYEIDGVTFRFKDTGELIGSIGEEGVGVEIANYAVQFVGNPYKYGGTSLTEGADCSGFVQSVYKEFGINIRRTTYEQVEDGRPITRTELAPGDLVFYYSEYSHVAIYIGDDQVVHAQNEEKGITITSIDYVKPTAYRRYW